MVNEIKIDLPVCNQFDEEHDKAWAHRICAICSLWMLLKHYQPALQVSTKELLEKALARNGYLENVGWKHTAIVELAEEYGLKLKYASKFYYSPEEKETGVNVINGNLEKNFPVLVSVFHELNPAKGAHMVVVHGLQEFGGAVIGYYVQDPDARFRGHNYFLTKQEFVNGWRGGLISSLDL